MPITDNNFTKEEFQGALAANPELVTLVGGFVTDPANVEHPLYKHIQPVISQGITSKHAADIEKDVKEVTGIDKATPDEKYYVYMKRAMKTLHDGKSSMQTELDALKGKSDVSAAERARMKQLEDGIAAKNEEIKTKVGEKEKEILQLRSQNHIEKALAKLQQRYKKDLDPDIIQMVEEKAISAILPFAQIQGDKKLAFLNPEGTEILKDAHTYQPLDAEAMLLPYLKTIIDPGHKAAGAGTQPAAAGAGAAAAAAAAAASGSGGAGAAETKFKGLPADVTTQVGLVEHLLKLGLTDSDKEFADVLQRYSTGADGVKKLPIR